MRSGGREGTARRAAFWPWGRIELTSLGDIEYSVVISLQLYGYHSAEQMYVTSDYVSVPIWPSGPDYPATQAKLQLMLSGAAPLDAHTGLATQAGVELRGLPPPSGSPVLVEAYPPAFRAVARLTLVFSDIGLS